VGSVVVRRHVILLLPLKFEKVVQPKDEIDSGPERKDRIVLQVSQSDIALAAEQSADQAGRMAVVDGQPPGAPPLADHATSGLPGHHLVERFDRKSVSRFEPGGPAVLQASDVTGRPECRIGCVSAPTPRIDLGPVGLPNFLLVALVRSRNS
jgi:hypothetical protein